MSNAPDSTLTELFASSPEVLSDPAARAHLSEIIKQSLRAQEELAVLFAKHEMGAGEFQARAQSEHRKVLDEIKTTIGIDRFYKTFGDEGNHPEFVADPEPFYKALAEPLP